MTTKKTLLFTHDKCDDGYACYWVLSKFHDVEPMFLNYGREVDCLREKILAMCVDRDVIVADFSFDTPMLIQMAQVSNSFVMLDHHKSALDKIRESIKEGIPDIYEVAPEGNLRKFRIRGAQCYIAFDMHRCGSRMLWDYVSEGALTPKLLTYIDLNDRGKAQELSGTNRVIAYLRSYQHDDTSWNEVAALLDTDESHSDVIKHGASILRAHRQNVSNLLTWVPPQVITLGGHAGLAVNSTRSLASDVSNELAKQSGTFGATWWYDAGRIKVSLRSLPEPDFDVALVAEVYGGGGHKRAAGFELSPVDFFSCLN